MATWPLTALGMLAELRYCGLGNRTDRRSVTVRLVGREREERRIEVLLDAARTGTSGVLVVSGEAGIGKSALLARAQELAVGLRVLGTRGVESEATVPFAGLLEIVRPIERSLDLIPAHLAAAIRAALALGPPVPAPPLQLGVAVLSLLAAASDERPLLVVIDDAHWLDVASSSALLFASRRLGAEGVAMLLAVRDGEPRVPDTGGLEELSLAGLDTDSAGALLADLELASGLVARLNRAVGGNPLALIESARLLTPRQRAGHAPLPELLRAGERIERAFARRFVAFDADVRRALLIAAVANGSHLGEVAAALHRDGLAVDSLAPAERSRIVTLHDDRVEFSHPLLRSACYHTASAPQRRAAHLALAVALEREAPERSVLERAAAAVEPDDELAASLDRVARDTATRGAPLDAARTWQRAAAVSSRRADRTRRLAEAAHAAVLGADFAYAIELSRQGLADARDARLRGWLEVQRALALVGVAPPRTVEGELLQAAGRIAEHDRGQAAMILRQVVFTCMMQGDCRRALMHAENAVGLTAGCGGLSELNARTGLAITRVARGGGASEVATLLQIDAELEQHGLGALPLATVAQPLTSSRAWRRSRRGWVS